MKNTNRSEVARLKQEIEDGYHAGRLALHGFAEVASHEHATRSAERMWDDFEKLRRIAGEEEAEKFLKRL